MQKIAALGSIVLSVLLLAPAVFADEGGNGARTYMKVNGVVSKVQPGVVFVKTPWGQMALSAPSGLDGLQVGEEVEMQVNENNAVIDVHRKGEPAHAHRYVTGTVAYASAAKQEIRLWTPEGEHTFPVARGRSKLSVLEEGAPVTVELNEAGNVIDVHRGLTVEMALDDIPKTKPGYHMTLHGEVTKISRA